MRARRDPGSGEDANRVERWPSEPHVPHHREQQEGAEDADGEADGHLLGELGDDDREVALVLGRELDHPDHQGDPHHRVVHSGLALQDGARTSADLTRAEDRERHRRVGRRDRRADEPARIHSKPRT
jgi:hypothetical protein